MVKVLMVKEMRDKEVMMGIVMGRFGRLGGWVRWLWVYENIVGVERNGERGFEGEREVFE